MKKLELWQLAKYLPYKVKIQCTDGVQVLNSIDCGITYVNFGWGNAKLLDEIKPILKPLSELNVAKMDGFTFMDALREVSSCFRFDYMEDMDGTKWIGFSPNFDDDGGDMTMQDLSIAYEWLYENHYDVYGLIEKGLAIDINTL